MRVKIHITQLKCWSCAHLQRYFLEPRHRYCIRNKVIPEYVQPDFAVNCADYKPTKKEAQKK